MKLFKQAEYMAATGFTLHPTIAFRSGLGPYMAQEFISKMTKFPDSADSEEWVYRPSVHFFFCKAYDHTFATRRTWWVL
ncbi:hypothetical protein [Candidatus Binatus sp.]|jgi:hypothetical protein|uniref:hypothetical protein n=1 Tax=Candidatus Binatus sp. TaxID=2811406 RepID=UPI003BE2B744